MDDKARYNFAALVRDYRFAWRKLDQRISDEERDHLRCMDGLRDVVYDFVRARREEADENAGALTNFLQTALLEVADRAIDLASREPNLIKNGQSVVIELFDEFNSETAHGSVSVPSVLAFLHETKEESGLRSLIDVSQRKASLRRESVKVQSVNNFSTAELV